MIFPFFRCRALFCFCDSESKYFFTMSNFQPIARALRSRLALASFKDTNKVTNVPFHILEAAQDPRNISALPNDRELKVSKKCKLVESVQFYFHLAYSGNL